MNSKIIYENLLKGIKSSITEDMLKTNNPKKLESLAEVKLLYIRLLDIIQGHRSVVK